MGDSERYIDDERRTSNGCPVAKRVPRADANFRVPSRNVAAIDFGTTNCSVAYLTASDDETQGPQRLTLNNTHQRVPTAILFKEDGKIVSFGHEARNDYLALDDGDRLKYYYFEEIKMNLQLEEDVSREMTVKAANGKVFYLVGVIAHILKYLKRELLESLKRAGHPLKVTDFDWVVTVPAIWKARGKQMMREAGYKAGLCSEEECGNLSLDLTDPPKLTTAHFPELLLLALEPESAAVHCHNQLHRLSEAYGPQQMLSTGGYMIVDIGGGTVDISVYNMVQIGQHHSVEIVRPPAGIGLGGSSVNKRFCEFLQKFVDDLGFQKYVNGSDNQTNVKHKAHLNELLNLIFERQKTLFGARDASAPRAVNIRLPETFARVYESSLETGLSRFPDVKLREKQTLVIPQSRMESYFEPVLTEIVENIQDALKGLDDHIKTVYIVGGFGGSRYVQRFLKAKLEPRYCCRVPEDPQFSVVMGAVRFGANPQIVHARVADATYGVGVCAKFDPEIHHEGYKHPNNENIMYCHNLFSTFVQQSDLVCTDYVFANTFHPLERNQRSMKFSVYCTLEKDVWYVTKRAGKTSQSGKSIKIYKVGEFTVEMPIPDGDKARKVEVTFDFGHTEIQIRGYDKTSRKSVTVTVDFLSSYTKNDPFISVTEQ